MWQAVCSFSPPLHVGCKAPPACLHGPQWAFAGLCLSEVGVESYLLVQSCSVGQSHSELWHCPPPTKDVVEYYTCGTLIAFSRNKHKIHHLIHSVCFSFVVFANQHEHMNGNSLVFETNEITMIWKTRLFLFHIYSQRLWMKTFLGKITFYSRELGCLFCFKVRINCLYC